MSRSARRTRRRASPTCTPCPGCDRRLLHVVIVPVPAHGDEPAHEHADVRYLLATDRPGDIAAESAEAVLRWRPLDDAIRGVSRGQPPGRSGTRARDALR